MFILLFSLICCYSDPVEVTLFKPGDEGSNQYRIPAIVRTKDGTLVTATDKRYNGGGDLPGKIDVVVKLSHDNGRTWGETITVASGNPKGYGDAALVVDEKSGAIFCIFNGNNGFWQSTPTDPIRNYFCVSNDGGKTWSTPVDITPQLYGAECPVPERQQWAGMFISSGAALQLRSGRIMAVGVVRKVNVGGIFNYVVYTDDLGKTWNVGIKEGCNSGDESKVVELNNGDVLMSIRHAPYRFEALSHDKGLTFDPYKKREDIVDPACNGDIIRYTSTKDGYNKDRLLLCNDHSTSGRKNLSIKISYDEGKSWPVSKVLHAGGASYASCAVTKDGDIATYYEKSGDGGNWLTVATFSLEWVTDGKDTYKPPNPAKKQDKKKR